jgi:apolipoprotein N-acyltransferase
MARIVAGTKGRFKSKLEQECRSPTRRDGDESIAGLSDRRPARQRERLRVRLLPLAFAFRSGKLPRLKKSPVQPEACSRYLLAVVSGVSLAMAFPRFSFASLAWVAPGLLLFTAMGQGGGRAFRIGWIGGLAFNLAALHWLLHTCRLFDMPVAITPVFGWLALAAYCALYPAVWVWLCWKCFPRARDRRSIDAENRGGDRLPPAWVAHFAELSWFQRASWSLACAALWVGLEFILGRVFTGFPWLPLGVSQYKLTALIQIASVTGVHGVSFTVVWFAVALGCALVTVFTQSSARGRAFAELRLPLLALLIVLAWSSTRLTQAPASTSELKLALIQPSIPQRMIWNASEKTNRFRQLLNLSESALAARPDLLVWPEAALPSMSEQMYEETLGLVRRHATPFIFGADDVELRAGASRESRDPKDYQFYNAAFLLNSRGELVERYRKRRLVIVGEYTPLMRWLPFMKYLSPVEADLTPGAKAVQFPLPKGRTTSVVICFEDIFPQTARESAAAQPDFLLNLTNDGWFGESAEQWQHAANAVFRAVENGLPLVRCANNGLTCWIDPMGRMHDVHFGDSPDIYRAGFKIVSVPCIPSGVERSRTLYSLWGDWFGWGCVAVLGLAGSMIFWRGRKVRT